MRRKAQHDPRFLEPKRKPLIPDFISLPESRHTTKRFTRSLVKEISQPKPIAKPVLEPKLALPESRETLQDKLIRLGWQDENGRSIDWTHWNRFQPCYEKL